MLKYSQLNVNSPDDRRILTARGAAINGHWIYGCIGSTALTGANQACGVVRGKRYQPKHIFHVRLPAIFHGSFPAKSIYHRERDRPRAVGFRTPVSLTTFPLYCRRFTPSLGSFELPGARRLIPSSVSLWLRNTLNFYDEKRTWQIGFWCPVVQYRLISNEGSCEVLSIDCNKIL